MRTIDEQFVPTARGGILYDASRLRKPGDELFEPDHWAARGTLTQLRGGRGTVAFLEADGEQWVLRHYRRGGWAARLVRDSYAWLGRRRVRSFAEWRLLAELRRRGLPVPAPLAARYVRSGCSYRADLITERLPASRTLADSITGAALPPEQWLELGRTLATFHRHGVHHADLNAHNILLGSEPARPGTAPGIYLLDFDRGRIRRPGAWQDAVLARLRRSLEKVRGQRADVRFGADEWRALGEGYEGKRLANSG